MADFFLKIVQSPDSPLCCYNLVGLSPGGSAAEYAAVYLICMFYFTSVCMRKCMSEQWREQTPSKQILYAWHKLTMFAKCVVI